MRQIPRNRLFAMAAGLFALAALPAALLATDAPSGGSSPGSDSSGGYSVDTSTPSGGAGSTTGVESSTGTVNQVPASNDASAGNRAQSPNDKSDASHAGNLQ